MVQRDVLVPDITRDQGRYVGKVRTSCAPLSSRVRFEDVPSGEEADVRRDGWD
jgi:hypothetical protein